MKNLVLTSKFKCSFRKFVRRDKSLQKRIEDTLLKMQLDIFAPNLGTHKLEGELKDYWLAPVVTIRAISF